MYETPNLILGLDTFTDVKQTDIYQYKNKKHSNTIYTFDIETTSLFNIDGEFKVFDYTKPYSFWTDNFIDKRSCVYACMFGVNDTVYLFRHFLDIEKILIKISNQKIKKYVYIHNLAWEFQFLRMILDKYTIDNMIATAKRKPISFYIKELNIEFRCSYRLTMLSLEQASEKYTDVKKAKGDLYYNLARSPLTKLTQQEIYYCYMDIICLYHIIKHFLTIYKSIAKIPLTQTGEVRKELKNRVDYFYIRKQQKLIPQPNIYNLLVQSFMGGITHGNYIYTGTPILQKEINSLIYSADEDSAYPNQMLDLLPIGEWHKISPQEIEWYKEKNYLLYVVTFKGLESKYYNHYIPISKCLRYKEAYIDNGRVVKIGECDMVLTDIDFEIIRDCYNIKEIDIKEVYASRKGYLDKRVINFILDLWQTKTKLKGISEDSPDFNFYMKQKQILNGLFGVSVTSLIKQNTIYGYNEETKKIDWGNIDISTADKLQEFLNDKIEKAKNSFSTLFPYSVGVWVCAKNREALFRNIIKNDDIVVYYDTDSIKSIGKIDFTAHNQAVFDRQLKMCEYYNINPNRLIGTDTKGVKHHIGFFDQEAKNTAVEFYTNGAKKYCYRTIDGKLHLTVSGVKKSSVTDLKDDINNFKDGFIFGYKQTNEYKNGEHEHEKLTHCYNDSQEPFYFTDIDGNNYKCTDTYGIILQPTTYKLGYTDFIEASQEEYI